VPSTFRADARDALYAYGLAFKAANPTLVSGDVYRTRPGSLVAPAIFVGSLNEPSIVQSYGIRQRTMAPTVVLVRRLIDKDETAQDKDDMVDGWLDYVDGNPHLTQYAVIATVSTQDVELDYAGTLYSATVVTHRLMIGEGRN
jgi:hypothetical protein